MFAAICDVPDFVGVFRDEESDGYTNTKQVLDELGVEKYTMDDCRHVQYICSTVSSRAAYLASAGEDVISKCERK